MEAGVCETGIEPKIIAKLWSQYPPREVAPEDEEPSALLVSCCKYRSS
jgi:hypothetical protein